MDRDQATQNMRSFLDANPIGIISTVHTDRPAPESAVVGFGNTEDLRLVFGTEISTRKYHNLQVNPNVALVIGWSSTTGSMQYEGTARELLLEELDSYSPLLLKKSESHRAHIGQDYQRYFLVIPTWIRFYDNAGMPPDVYELDF